MLQLNCVTHKIIVFMTKKLINNQTQSEKAMIRIPRDLYKTIKILAVTNDEEIGLLVENLLAIGLKRLQHEK